MSRLYSAIKCLSLEASSDRILGDVYSLTSQYIKDIIKLSFKQIEKFEWKIKNYGLHLQIEGCHIQNEGWYFGFCHSKYVLPWGQTGLLF